MKKYFQQLKVRKNEDDRDILFDPGQIFSTM